MKRTISIILAFVLAFGMLFSMAPAVKASEECWITLDPNGGEEISENMVYAEAGVEFELTTYAPYRFGYNFLGWSESDSAAEALFMPGDYVTVYESTTLYAVWEAATTITCGEGTITADAYGTENNGVFYKIVPTETTVYGFYSVGNQDTYAELYNSEGTSIESNDDSDEDSNFVLCVELEKNKSYYLYVRNFDSYTIDSIDFFFEEVYKVSFDANGGNNPPESQYAISEKEMRLTEEKPDRVGYVFLGWAESLTAEKPAYESGEAFVAKSDMTLYAVWGKSDYTVTYNPNGGEFVQNNQGKVEGESINITDVLPEKFGFTFMGWATSASSAKVSYKPGDEYSANANITLYAVWKEAANLGDVATVKNHMVSVPFSYGGEYVAFTVAESGIYSIYSDDDSAVDGRCKLYDEAETLIEENDDADGSRNFRIDAALEKGTTYYAYVDFYNENDRDIEMYVSKIYTVIYDINGGEGEIEEQNKRLGENIVLSDEEPERTGYYFAGWSTSDGGNVEYYPGDIYSAEKDAVMYAVWSEGSFNLSYNTNGSFDFVDNQTVAAGSKTKLRGDRPTRFGYYFDGWAKSPTAAVAEYQPQQIVEITEDTILYAVWCESVTIAGSEREEIEDAKTGDYIVFIPVVGGEYRIRGLAEKDNYVTVYDSDGEELMSNDDSADFEGNQFSIADYFEAGKKYYIQVSYFENTNEDLPFVIERGYEIVYDYNYDGGDRIGALKYHDIDATIASNNYDRADYEFLGWSTSSTATEAEYMNGDTYTENKGIKLYGVWKPEFAITQQPQDAEALEGEMVEVTVEAKGEGVTYQWYIKNKGDTKYTKSSITSATYAAVMDESRDGRILQCVVRDAFGGMIKSDVVTISMKAPTELKITQQPVSAEALSGELVSVTIEAQGDGLTYQWWIKNKGDTVYTKSSITSDTYSAVMNEARDGRIIRCVVKDKYGNLVRSDIVTISMKAAELKITQQPVNTSAANGETVKVTVEAEGDGVTYQWYIKNKGATKYTKSSITSNTYSTVMDEARDGRILQCVIRDQYGNMIKSDVVTITMLTETPLKITQQPVNASAANGETVKVTVKAEGDGVTYQWYIKNKGDTKYTKSSITSNVYQTNMTAAKDGRILQCVIKDKYGNMIKSDVVTITMLTQTPLKITQQPKSASAANGEYVSVTVKAEGDGVTYQWWVKNPGDEAYTKSSITSNVYQTNMTAAKDGRILRCVIKDKYGNLVRSDIVTITMK